MCISNVTKIKNIQNIQVMANQNKTDIGLIGLAVMGENLALNMESKGWHVSVYNRTVPGVEEGVVERFLNGRAKGKNIEGFTDIKAFVDSIAIPRKIMMMVRAGSPVDELMDQLSRCFHREISLLMAVILITKIRTVVSNWRNQRDFFSSVAVCPVVKREP